MATRSVEIRWTGEGLHFDAVTDRGTVAVADDPQPGSGPTPMQLLLVAVGTCTAIDVVDILRKMRQPLEGLSVEVVGEKTEEHPQRYTSIQVVFHLKGDLNEAKVRRAIELSETKYCSVEATLRDGVRVGSGFVIEDSD